MGPQNLRRPNRRTGTDDTVHNFSLPPKAAAQWKQSGARLQAYLILRLDDFQRGKAAGNG
jgi:hypothetical protein